MPYLIGISLALGVALLGWTVGFDRDRAFYATILIVVASYYDLFGVMGGSQQALLAELVPTVIFVVLAVVGFRSFPWLVVAGLVGHGVFDCFHSRLIANPGVPVFWPAFCASYDVTAGAVLAWILMRRKTAVQRAG